MDYRQILEIFILGLQALQEKQKTMDSTLWGVVIGAASTLVVTLLTALGAFLNNLYTSQREDKKWLREQKIEIRKRNREEKKLKEEKAKGDKDFINSIYLNSIKSLSALSAKEEIGEDDDGNVKYQFQISGEKRANLLEETNNWLAILALRHVNNSEFHSQLERFASEPNDRVGYLRDTVIELAKNDRDISFDVVVEQDRPIIKPDEVEFAISIDGEFRKEKFVETGVKIVPYYKLRYKLTELTEKQRQMLVNYIGVDFVDEIQLNVPKYDPNSKNFYYHNSWRAKLNPETTAPKDIFAAWEKDCDIILSKVEEKGSPDAEPKNL